jgi:D-amino-acid dehydrogenase
VPKWVIDPEGPIFIRKRYLASFLPWALKFLQAGKVEKVEKIGDAMMVLSDRSPSHYRELLSGTSELELVKDSYYIFAYKKAEQASFDHFGWQMRKKRKVPLSLINAEQLQELEPYISKKFEAAILIHEQARALNPHAIGKALVSKARALGVKFFQSKVKFIQKEDNVWVTNCAENKYFSGKLVLAAGVWSASLLRPFGYDLPLQAERGYHLLCQNPEITINHSIMDVEHMCVASQMESGIRIAGTAEFAGIEAKPDHRRAFVFKKALKNLFPSINVDHAEPWMGRRPTFPDSLPCIGPVPNLKGLFAAFGHSHYGLGQAPNTGQIVADCIMGKKSGVDMKPYRIDRFK